MATILQHLPLCRRPVCLGGSRPQGKAWELVAQSSAIVRQAMWINVPASSSIHKNSEMCFTPSPRSLHWDWAPVAHTGIQLMDTALIGGPPFPLSLSHSFMVLLGIAAQINNLYLGSSILLSAALRRLPSAQLLAASICIFLWVWCFSLAIGIKHSRGNAPAHPPATVQDAWIPHPHPSGRQLRCVTYTRMKLQLLRVYILIVCLIWLSSLPWLTFLFPLSCFQINDLSLNLCLRVWLWGKWKDTSFAIRNFQLRYHFDLIAESCFKFPPKYRVEHAVLWLNSTPVIMPFGAEADDSYSLGGRTSSFLWH